MSPTLERIDRWTASWQSQATQKLSRILDQNSYDHQASTKQNKHLERILLDGFDKCKTTLPMDNNEKMNDNNNNKNNRFEKESEEDEADIVFDTNKANLSDEPSKSSDDHRGCEDLNLVDSGVSKVFRVGSSHINAGGRDFNIRYCDQKTAGGGWTVSYKKFL